ncbi:hypothetical protein, partial [Solemya velum gill symbiont]
MFKNGGDVKTTRIVLENDSFHSRGTETSSVEDGYRGTTMYFEGNRFKYLQGNYSRAKRHRSV